jgi:DNA-binding protein HU-beta
MTKAELVAKMAKDAKLSKAAAGRALNGAIEAITKALKKGDSVTLVGFGTFSVSKRKARKGRNPQTGKEIKIAARKVAKFKAGSELKKTVK